MIAVNVLIECQMNRLFPVSIGATASFFTGVCVLGLIEVIYFFTIRLFWHLLGKKIEPAIKTETFINIEKSEYKHRQTV